MFASSLWRMLVRTNDAIHAFFRVVCASLVVVMVVTVFVRVFTRYVFHLSLPWSEEIAVYSFIWITFLGISLGVRDQNHLLADVMPSNLRPAIDRALWLVVYAVTTFVAFLFLYYGWKYAVFGLRRYSISMKFQMTYIYASMPVAGVAIALFLAERVVTLFRAETRT